MMGASIIIPYCTHFFKYYLRKKLILDAEHKDDEHDERQDIAHIEANAVAHLDAAALVRLVLEILPSPAIARGAEQQIDERAKRKPQIGNQKILKIENVRARAERLKSAPDIEAENARHGQQDHQNDVDRRSLFAAPAGQIHAAGHDVLENSEHGRECRERHEYKEQTAPQTAARHVVEDVGQGDEDEVRAAVRGYVEREARREDDQAGRERNEGVEHGDVDRFSHERASLADIAAEDRHRADAERQGEERLIHRAHDHVRHTGLRHAAEVRNEVKAQALARARGADAVDGEHDHDGEQRDHHDLGHALQTALKAERVDEEADDDDRDHAARHDARPGQHFTERRADLLGRCSDKSARCGQIEIVQHPAADRRVEHHQQIVADHRQITVDMPPAARLFQYLIGAHRAFLAGAADRELHRHDRQTEYEQEDHIEQNEGAAAVLSDHPRELPYVADADGAACAEQNKAQTRTESFSLHLFFNPTYYYFSLSQNASCCDSPLSAAAFSLFCAFLMSLRFFRSSRKNVRSSSAHCSSITPEMSSG